MLFQSSVNLRHKNNGSNFALQQFDKKMSAGCFLGSCGTLQDRCVQRKEHTQMLRVVNISPSSLRVSIIGPILDTL